MAPRRPPMARLVRLRVRCRFAPVLFVPVLVMHHCSVTSDAASVPCAFQNLGTLQNVWCRRLIMHGMCCMGKHITCSRYTAVEASALEAAHFIPCSAHYGGSKGCARHEGGAADR